MAVASASRTIYIFFSFHKVPRGTTPYGSWSPLSYVRRGSYRQAPQTIDGSGTPEELMTRAKAAMKMASHSEALALYKKASLSGNSVALYNVAQMLLHGVGSKQDITAAAKILTVLAEADHGESQYQLAILKLKAPSGVSNEVDIAIKLLEKSIQNGVVRAYNDLGLLFSPGGGGVAVDLIRALKYFEQGMAAGDPGCMLSLACLHGNAEGNLAAQEKSFALNSAAARKGHHMGYYNLGTHYLTGRGVRQSYVQALDYFRLAADSGNMFAQMNLAAMYEHGEGIDQDLPAAIALYKVAATTNTDAANKVIELTDKIEKESAGSLLGRLWLRFKRI